MASIKYDAKGLFAVPCVSVPDAHSRNSTIGNANGACPMQERIFIGHRFKSDEERSKKLLELCSKMSTAVAPKPTLKAQA